MRNIALRLKYDGSRYHGWQIQKNDITVAQTLEEALEKVLGEHVRVTGCGRTDAGVHALRYCANFKAETNIPADRIPLAVNSRLPSDIAVTAACDVDDDFNAISSCIKKEYIYKILNDRIRDPFLADRVCFWPQHLDMELISRAAAAFEGTHDFRAVRSLGTETKTTVRTVFSCSAVKEGSMITVSVCADGFLYNMCRAMVGTMVYAAYGKLLPEDIPSLLEKGDRRLTGPTMPPQGLYLNRVWYEGPAGIMLQD
ncbi:MAG: tRNA pseudouridine(38-40) synthase TruA [Eubacteriales bacterium]|nr:tRNA pseudouridine(38-40) synthase TruA [Eubacteriales bacterium]